MAIALGAVLVIAALLASSALSTAAATEPLTGRVYVEGVVGSPQQLNPLVQDENASQAERDLAALLFEGLTQIGPDGSVQPALAESWTASDDARVYTFTLADRAWHDGAPVTADDVLYTVRGVQNAEFPGDPAVAALWRNVLVEAPDDRTIRFELSAPTASFPSIARLPILPSHLYRTLRPGQWPTAQWSQRPIGTGRYMLQAIDNDQMLLAPFSDHPDAPSLDALLLRFYPTADAAVLALSRREVSGVATVATAGRRAPDPPRHTRRVVAPLGDYTILTFNLDQPPLDDLQFREAMALGINRELLINTVLGGQGRQLDTPILPGTWAFDEAAQLPAFRRSAAQQQLGALGYVDTNGDGFLERDGQRLVLPLLVADTSEFTALASEIARQLRAIGIAIEVRRVPPSELPAELAARNFALALHRWNNVGADPDVFALWHSSQAEGRFNYAGLRDQQIDQLLAEARATTDDDQRAELYGAFQQRWSALIPSLPLYQSVLVYDIDAAIDIPRQPAPLLISRADRWTLVDRWRVPER